MTTDLAHDDRITAVGLFGEAFTGLTSKFTAQIGEHGLSLIEFEVLIRLARSANEQLRMTDLAAQTSLTSSGVTRVVDRMERGGLVVRRACDRDRRSLYAVLSASGKDRLSAVLPGHLDLIERWFTGLLNTEQLDGMMAGLRTIRDAVRPCATAGANPLEQTGASTDANTIQPDPGTGS